MKILATIREFTSILFNKSNGDDIEIKPASTAKDAAAEIAYDLPDGGTAVGDADDTIVLAAETQVLTNKTIDGDDNTLQDIGITSFKNTGATDVFITKDGSGDPIETKAVPTGDVIGDSDTQTMSNKTLTSPKLNEIIETSSSDVYSLPNISGNDTLVSRTSSDTLANRLKNKDLETATTYFAESSDPTNKRARIDLSALSASRNLNVPALPADDTFVFEAQAQTLTNKTLTSPNVNEAVALTSTATELNQLDGVTVGGTSTGDITTIDGTQTLSNKTISTLKYDEANVTRDTDIAGPLSTATIIHITGTAGNIETLAGGADGDTRIIINETGGTISLVENAGAEGFHTGSGADLDILDNGAVQVVYEATEARWRVIGGAGGSGGGLTLSVIDDSFATTASANTHYLIDNVNTPTAFSITLPPGSTGDIIRFTDSSKNWGTYNVTLTPDGSETIDGETCLILDVSESWVQLMWNGTQWVTDDSFEPQLVDLTGNLSTSGSVSAEQGFISTDTAGRDLTIDSGNTLTHPYLTIDTGVTYTNNGQMHVAGDLIVTGTLIDNGTVYNN